MRSIFSNNLLRPLILCGFLIIPALGSSEPVKRYEMSIEGYQARVIENEKEVQLEIFNVTSATPMIVKKSKSSFRKKEGAQVVTADFAPAGPKLKGETVLKLSLPKEAKMKRIEVRVTQKGSKPYAPLMVWPLP